MQETLPTGVNASHVGVPVASASDVLEAKRRFEAAALSTFSEQDTSCCYALQDERLAGGGALRSRYARTPARRVRHASRGFSTGAATAARTYPGLCDNR
jgi:hypothetical protein